MGGARRAPSSIAGWGPAAGQELPPPSMNQLLGQVMVLDFRSFDNWARQLCSAVQLGWHVVEELHQHGAELLTFLSYSGGFGCTGGGGRWGSAGSHPWQPESKCHRLLGTSAHEKSVEHCWFFSLIMNDVQSSSYLGRHAGNLQAVCSPGRSCLVVSAATEMWSVVLASRLAKMSLCLCQGMRTAS